LQEREQPELGAQRELQEELGYVAGHMEKLAEFFVSPGFLEEKMWLFLATDLVQTQQQLEDDEILDVVRVPFSEALLMVADGEIEDAKTIIGLTLAAPRIGVTVSETEYPAV
jgi:ADP-ribose pyrophosphatase